MSAVLASTHSALSSKLPAAQAAHRLLHALIIRRAQILQGPWEPLDDLGSTLSRGLFASEPAGSVLCIPPAHLHALDAVYDLHIEAQAPQQLQRVLPLGFVLRQADEVGLYGDPGPPAAIVCALAVPLPSLRASPWISLKRRCKAANTIALHFIMV
jgi:hypothetical protein